jgi:hypothetical protein
MGFRAHGRLKRKDRLHGSNREANFLPSAGELLSLLRGEQTTLVDQSMQEEPPVLNQL